MTNLANLFQFENAVARIDKLTKMEQIHLKELSGNEYDKGPYPDINFDEEIRWLDESIVEFHDRVKSILNRLGD